MSLLCFSVSSTHPPALGDQDTDGGISTSAGENAVATGGFVLWAAGLDEAFGPVTSGGTMDANVITNRKLAQECDDLIHVNN